MSFFRTDPVGAPVPPPPPKDPIRDALLREGWVDNSDMSWLFGYLVFEPALTRVEEALMGQYKLRPPRGKFTSITAEYNRRQKAQLEELEKERAKVAYKDINHAFAADYRRRFRTKDWHNFSDPPEVLDQIEAQKKANLELHRRVQDLEDTNSQGARLLTRREAKERIEKLEAQVQSLKDLFRLDRQGVVVLDDKVAHLSQAVDSLDRLQLAQNVALLNHVGGEGKQPHKKTKPPKK